MKALKVKAMEMDLRIRKGNLATIMLIIAAMICPFGGKVLAINIGAGHVTLFRVFLIVAILMRFITSKRLLIYSANNKNSVAFIFVWFMYASLNIIIVKDISSFISSMIFLAEFIAMTLLIMNSPTIYAIYGIMLGILVGSLIQASIGIYEMVTRDYKFITANNAKEFITVRFGTPIATMTNPNDFATLMLIGVCICIILINTQKCRQYKLIFICTIILECILIGFSTSRACIGGLIIMLGLYMFIKSNRIIRLLVIVVMACGLMYVILSSECLTAISEYINIHFNFTNPYESGGMRIKLVKNGLVFLMNTYFLGVGSGQAVYWMFNYNVYDVGALGDMHNWFAEILTCWGLFIFTFFMLFYMGLMVFFYRIYKKCKYMDRRFSNIGLIVTCFLTGFILASISSSSNLRSECVWMFIAILIALQGRIDEGVVE